MKNIVYKFTTIKTGVLVEKSWSAATDVEDYYNREQENYAFASYNDAADWLKSDSAPAIVIVADVQAEAPATN